MRKIYLILTSLTLLPLSVIGYEVSTEPQKRHVLIEEFTGIHCGFCPQAHEITHNLQYFHPENIHVIALHQNDYAKPAIDEPDYRTVDGDLIGDGMNMTETGRPSGMVNRRLMEYSDGSTSYSTGRANWGKLAKDMVEEDAPVNLYVKAECDALTRVLKITVEGYYTAAVEQATNYLHLAMTQDDIMGPQNGANMGDEYMHQRMLRDYITDVWGDAITPVKGEYFTKEYEYIVPEEILYNESRKQGVPVVLQDINVVAFVTTDGKEEVLNVTEAKPTFSNLELPLAAELESTVIESKRYGFNYFEFSFKNKCVTTLTSAEFTITINDEVQTATWEGELASMKSEVIKLPINSFTYKDSNSYTIALSKLNGEAVEETDRNVLTGKFTPPAECTQTVIITVQADPWPNENSWRVLDADGNVVVDNVYSDRSDILYKAEIELEADKVYCFEILDYWVDGIDQGMYKISNDDKSMVEQNYSFPDTGWRTFFRTSLAGVENVVAESSMKIDNNTKTITATGDIEVYSASGYKVLTGKNQISLSDFSAGIYIVRCGAETMKVILK